MLKHIAIGLTCTLPFFALAGQRGPITCIGGDTGQSTLNFQLVTSERDRWNPAEREVPALAPGAALQIATKAMQALPPARHMKGWRVDAIALEPVEPNTWVYMVLFTGEPAERADRTPWNGPVPTCRVPVLLDGTVPYAR